jgi:NAD(P)-dependent dehydrogenase (short-subunit alcohol dehydrogenase family)
MDELRFDDVVAVVTGAGGGIGRGHALALAERGAKVVVADLGCDLDGSGASKEPADAVVAEIRAKGGEAEASYASVADEAGAASIVEQAIDAYGRLDVVINNAGIFHPAPFDELSTEEVRSMIATHLLGTFLVTRAAWPHLVSSGHGRIVNTTSESIIGMELLADYGAAKGGVFSLTRTLAIEGAPLGIRANCVCPRAGTRMAISHALVMGVPAEHLVDAATVMPPEVIAPVATYLAHRSCEVNGETLYVTPGQVSRLALIKTRGVEAPSFRPEDVAARIDEILDPSGALVTDLTRLP